MRIPYETMKNEFSRVLRSYGLPEPDVELSSTLFADASRDGVYTHGLNRFVKFIASIDNKSVDVSARATMVQSFGPLERWDGHRGPGNLNAHAAMERTIALAKEHTIGSVALSNTNHWMRPGSYGLMAAQRDCIGILWTNTVPNMPPWGGAEAKLGNNPLVVAIPHDPCPVLVDVAMSMFSYGKLEKYAREGKALPVDGGFDDRGAISRDPEAILASHRTLPIGYWKGSGLSLVLDLIASSLAGGRTSRQVGELPTETELSQFFLAIDLGKFPDRERIGREIDATLADIDACRPIDGEHPVHYPGEGMARTRQENLRDGIPVDEGIWQQVLAM